MDNGSGSGSGGSSSSDSFSAAGTATHKRPPCAACKFQHRKCMPDCVLAPFFPAAEKQRFLNAHSLFGVRNMQKKVEALDPEQRAETMKTIIFESEVHAIDPVGGCHCLILDLESQLQQYLAELDIVNGRLIARCEQAAQAMPAANMPPVIAAAPPPVSANSTCSDLIPLGTAAENANNLMLYDGDANFPAISDDDLGYYMLGDLLMSPKLQEHLRELDFVNGELIACHEQDAQAMPAANMPPVVAAAPPPVANSTCSDLSTPLGTAAESANNLMLYDGDDAFPAIRDDDLDNLWLDGTAVKLFEDLMMSPKATNVC